MTEVGIICPKCSNQAHKWRKENGELMGTCHHLNQDSHLGRRYTWCITTGEAIYPRDPLQAKFLDVFQCGEPHDMRGFDGEFLYEKCGVISVKSQDIGNIFGDEYGIFKWAVDREDSGCFVSVLALKNGKGICGLQFRAFEVRSGDAHGGAENTRTIGKDGIYVPPMAGKNFEATVVHEGPWGAIAQIWDARKYGASNIGALAVASASTSTHVLNDVATNLVPGIPLFFMSDNDEAGWAQRYRAKDIGILITLPPVGDGKDYKDLPSEFRYEELAKLVYRFLNDRDKAGGVKVPLSDEELDIRLAKVIRTEFGLATRFTMRFGNITRFVEGWGKWIVFNGKTWEQSNLKASLYAQHTIKALTNEAFYVD